MLPIRRNEVLPQLGEESAEQTRRQQQGRGQGQYIRNSQELAEDTVGKGSLVCADMAGVGKVVNTLLAIRTLTVFRVPVKGGRKHGRQIDCQQKG